MIRRKSIAIIGAGISGIAAGRIFESTGHRVTLFEQADDVGGVWHPSRRYPGVRTQSPKDLYRFTDRAMPADYPEWPTGAEVHRYLRRYAEDHGLIGSMRFGTTVTSMVRRADGAPGWTVTSRRGGVEATEDFDFVAICAGQFARPRRLEVEGLDAFEGAGGEVMHSSAYTDASAVAGKRVVVLGGSKSATDVAVQALADGARSVTLVYRRNVWRVPYRVAGINFKRLLYMRAQERQFAGWGESGWQRLVSRLIRPFAWLNFRALEAVLTRQLGLRRWDMVPDTPIEQAVSCTLPLVTPGLFEAFRSGAIEPIRAEIAAADAEGLTLTNGERLECDALLTAIGWEQGHAFLPASVRAAIVDEDGQYGLHRWAVHPDAPDLGFIGLNSSFCTMLSSELIAHWLVRHMDGQLAAGADAEAMRADIAAMKAWRRDERPAAQAYGGQCVAPFHYRHFDELLADIGARVRRRGNPIAENFSYPDADAYGRFLASAPRYAVGPAAEVAAGPALGVAEALGA